MSDSFLEPSQDLDTSLVEQKRDDIGTTQWAQDWITNSVIGGAQGATTVDFGNMAGITGGLWTTNTTAIPGAVGGPYTITTGSNTGTYTWNTSNTPTTLSAEGQMELRGKNADIVINGQSLSDWMQAVEQRLNILRPNPNLEKEWDELRELGERYRELEKKCQEKAEVWKQLKKMPAPSPDQL